MPYSQSGVLISFRKPAEGVISKTAALAARKHGDARTAVNALYEAGREGNESTGTEAHADDVAWAAEVFEAYTRVAEWTDTDPLSYDRVQRLLNEQAFFGITESEYTGGGPGEGSYRIHRLMRRADVVVEAIEGQ